jgi:hypothetical protein
MVRILFFYLLISTFSFAQENRTLSFLPKFGGEKIQLEKQLVISPNDWIQITTLRFYISDLTIYSDGKVWNDPNKFHLIDLEDSISLLVHGIPEKVDSLSFEIGIDSLTNVSGILEGPLDPINGMYWAWNSGYINFKLEGKSSRTKTANQQFEYHIGGYLPPFQTLHNKKIAQESFPDKIIIALELDSFLNEFNLSLIHTVMIPGKKARDISQILPSLFTVSSDEK